MKKILSILIIVVSVLFVGCANNKEEVYLQSVENIMQREVDKYNKTVLEDKITLSRKGNEITYRIGITDSPTTSEMMKSFDEETNKRMAKDIRQSTLDSLNYYYDMIVSEVGDDYDFYLISEKYMGNEDMLIMSLGKDNYEIKRDLYSENGF